MLATFCLRLSCGLAGALLILSPAQINPRFYRAHFLIILGLTALAMTGASSPVLTGLLGVGLGLAFLAAVLWSLDGAPGGRMAMWAVAFVQLLALGASTDLPVAEGARDAERHATFYDEPREQESAPWRFADSLSSAALLGSATTAMLIGHSYLVAPAMSMTPLLRLLAAWLAATILRLGLASYGLWSWTAGHSLANLEDETVLWLPVRWGLGFLVPLVLGWMVWQTAKIRSTQSATGILYVVVICCFLGELTSQVLWRSTGFVL